MVLSISGRLCKISVPLVRVCVEHLLEVESVTRWTPRVRDRTKEQLCTAGQTADP